MIDKKRFRNIFIELNKQDKIFLIKSELESPKLNVKKGFPIYLLIKQLFEEDNEIELYKEIRRFLRDNKKFVLNEKEVEFLDPEYSDTKKIKMLMEFMNKDE